MIDATEEALSFTSGISRQEFSSNRMLILSVIKDIEIIGEAASRVTSDTKTDYPKIPWKDIILMRNRLIHGYFDVDISLVWNTVEQDLPELLQMLKKIT